MSRDESTAAQLPRLWSERLRNCWVATGDELWAEDRTVEAICQWAGWFNLDEIETAAMLASYGFLRDGNQWADMLHREPWQPVPTINDERIALGFELFRRALSDESEG